MVAPSLRSALGKGRTAAGGVGEGRRPPFLFVFARRPAVSVGGGFKVRCGSIGGFEPQAF